MGSTILDILRRWDLPVRALVLREDRRTDALRANSVDVVVGDLTEARDVAAALAGCRLLWHECVFELFGGDGHHGPMPRERPDMEVLVNISQMTVSQMSLMEITDSPQQRQQWLGEQVLNLSGLPVVNVRPTVFLQHPFFAEWAAESIARDSTIRLPFRTGRTSPIDARDVAEIISAILVSPATHIGKVYELTGPRSQNMHGAAAEYSEALGRPLKYVDVPFDQWRDQVVRTHNLSAHVSEHFLTMARLHATNRYDRLTHNVETIIGRPAISVRDFVAEHRDRDVFDKQMAIA